jgi:C4-dicarboxylate-binding protein DctP
MPVEHEFLTRRGVLRAAGGLAVGGAMAGLAGCATKSGASASASTSASGAAKVTGPTMNLKFSMSPLLDSPEGRAATMVAQQLKEQSNGTLTMTVYPAYSLAPSDTVALQQLSTGALDMAAVSSWTPVITDGQVFELPYAFPTLANLRSALAGPPGKTVQASAPALGMQLLNWWVITWRNVFGDKPIHTPADFKGVKIRTQGTVALNTYYEAVGAKPESIASTEIYLALQTKQVDLVESSYQFCQQEKCYEVAKYASSDEHGISTLALLVSNKVWQQMSPSQQQLVAKLFNASVAPHDADSAKSLASIPGFLTQHGMQIITPPSLDPFREIAVGLYPKLVTSASQKKVLQQVQAMGFAKV